MLFGELPLVGSFFLLFACLAYFCGEHAEIHPHDAQRMSQFVLIGLSALAVTARGVSVSKAWLGGVLLLFVLAGLSGGRWGLIEYLHVLMLVMLAMLWSARLRDRPEPCLLAFCVGLVAAYLVLLLPRWAALVFESLSFHPQEFFTGFSNQRFFGHWVTLTFPLLIAARQKAGNSSFHTTLLDLMAGLWLCFVVASGTRGSWFALSVVTLIAPLAGNAGWTLAKGMLRSACVGAVLYGLMFWLAPMLASGKTGLEGLSRIAEGAALSGREVLWSNSLSGIIARPLFGAGPMMFSAMPNGFAAHPHSLLLQLTYEWGIPLTLFVGLLAAGAIYRQVVRCRQDDDPLRAALLACIVGGLIQAQVDGVLVMPFGQILFVLLCAWLASLDGESAQCAPDTMHGRSRAFRCLLLLATATLLWLVSPEMRRLDEWEEETLLAQETDRYFPRFWAQGMIPTTRLPVMRQ